MKTQTIKSAIYFFFMALLFICTSGIASASHEKPPHGSWTGKITSVTDSSVTLSGITSREYGSACESKLKKAVTFKPEKGGFMISEKPVAIQKLSKHFKIGEIVTLRWVEEESRDKRLFFDISKGR